MPPNRSRTGFSALLAPSWIGETTVRKPRCTECRRPLGASPKYAVSSRRERTTSSTSSARRRRTVLSCTNKDLPRRSRERVPRPVVRSPSPPQGAPLEGDYRLPAAPVTRRAVRAMDRLELLERPAGADGDAGERGLGEVRRHLRLLPQPLVEALQQRAATGQHDAAVHDVRGELRRRAIERLLDRFDDLVERLFQRLADLLAGEHDGLRKARHHVAAPNLGLELLGHRTRRGDLPLQLLRRL